MSTAQTDPSQALTSRALRRRIAWVCSKRQMQSGVVLLSAVIFLSVLLLGATIAVRSGLFGGKITVSLAQQSQAQLLAESALIWCEKQVQSQVKLLQTSTTLLSIQPIPNTNPDAPTAWKDEANWGASGLSIQLPSELLQGSNSGIAVTPLPRCLVEEMLLPLQPGGEPSLRSFVVTVRAYSQGYTTTNGAIVKLQSNLHILPSD